MNTWKTSECFIDDSKQDSNVVIKGKFVTYEQKNWKWYASDQASFEGEGYLSYADYIARKTACLVEKSQNQNRSNLMSYADYQTQSFKVQSQGWFTRKGFLNSPAKLQTWRQANPISRKTPIWDYVISFRQSYQEKHRIFSSERAQKIVNATFDNFMQRNKVDPKAFVFTGAFHVDKPHHFHMHLQIHQTRPCKWSQKENREVFLTRGKFPIENINAWKKDIDKYLVTQRKIFRGFNLQRDEFVYKTIGGFEDYPTVKTILQDAQTIKQRLPRGRFQYNAIKDINTKQLVTRVTEKLIESNENSYKMFTEINNFIDTKVDKEITKFNPDQDLNTIENLELIREAKKKELFDHVANQTLKKIKSMPSIGYLPTTTRGKAKVVKTIKTKNQKLWGNFKKKEWWVRALEDLDRRLAREMKMLEREMAEIEHFR